MNTKELIENGQGTIYHELGHLIAFRLSGKSKNTDLGDIERFETGAISNRVVPVNCIYHFENALKQKDIILKNTSNVDRTLAWFIEVIAGCTFQCCFEKNPFKECFGFEPRKIGCIDHGNLATIRNLSSFKWSFDNVYQLQNDFKQIVKKYQLVQKLEPIVEKMKNDLIRIKDNQLVFEKNELKELINKIDILIKPNLIEDYLELVNKTKLQLLS